MVGELFVSFILFDLLSSLFRSHISLSLFWWSTLSDLCMYGILDVLYLSVFAFIIWYFRGFLTFIPCFWLLWGNSLEKFSFFKQFLANLMLSASLWDTRSQARVQLKTRIPRPDILNDRQWPSLLFNNLRVILFNGTCFLKQNEQQICIKVLYGCGTTEKVVVCHLKCPV